MSFEQSLADTAAAYLRRCIAEACGNMTRAAEIAEIDRRRIYRLCRRYGVSFGRIKPRLIRPSMASLPRISP